jgi:hypothetical protein
MYFFVSDKMDVFYPNKFYNILLKETRYVKLAKSLFHTLVHSRIPLYLHRKSNPVFTVWQHITLLVIRTI